MLTPAIGLRSVAFFDRVADGLVGPFWADRHRE